MPRFALADCNNFYASCERLFNPKLLGKPVVILSSNDACVIARSNEAKKLGIKMGEPFFKIKDLVKQHQVHVYSSNFTLYADISSRVMTVLSSCATDIEIYSVDEAFMFLPDVYPDMATGPLFYTEYAKHIQRKVKKNVGVPVSIGIGETKTLAKIANLFAKKNNSGVFDITHHPQLDELLASVPVEDVWGIGYRYKKKLAAQLIFNALQLKNADQRWIRKHLTVAGLRTVQELNGISCMSLSYAQARDSICVSRSFGKNIFDLDALKAALAHHVTKAGEKLRRQKTISGSLTIFFCYQRYSDPQRFYNYATVHLDRATAYTPALIRAATRCLENVYQPGLVYKKIGVILCDIGHEDMVQLSPFNDIPQDILDKQARMMRVVDAINTKLGRKVLFAADTFAKDWVAKADHRSARFTTDWDQILTIDI